jgi:hypothetical protein
MGIPTLVTDLFGTRSEVRLSLSSATEVSGVVWETEVGIPTQRVRYWTIPKGVTTCDGFERAEFHTFNYMTIFWEDPLEDLIRASHNKTHLISCCDENSTFFLGEQMKTIFVWLWYPYTFIYIFCILYLVVMYLCYKILSELSNSQ